MSKIVHRRHFLNKVICLHLIQQNVYHGKEIGTAVIAINIIAMSDINIPD